MGMRCDQYIGLNPKAKDFLRNNAQTNPVKVCPTCKHSTGGGLVSEKIGEIVGMFDESMADLHAYYSKDGRKIEEFIQAEPWSSGPCAFIALVWADTREIISESLWPEEEIANA